MKRLSALIAFLVMVGLAQGQADDLSQKRLENSPRHHEWKTIKTAKGREVKCFVVFPEVDKKKPVVIVIHENKGLTDWVRSVADQVAEAGYVAVAPDLLSGTGPKGGGTEAFPSSDAARNGIYKLNEEQVLNDLDAVFAFAKKMPAGNGKVAVSGFCWGGGKTFQYAAHNPNIAAAFVFYGTAPKEGELQSIKAPVYGFYGGSDFRITGQVPGITKKMKSLEKDYVPVTYDKAGHGFMRSGEGADANAANRAARNSAWQRWRELLGKL